MSSFAYNDNSFLNPGPAPRPPGARSPLSVNSISNQSNQHPHHSTSSTLTASTIVSPSPYGSTISLSSNSTGIMNGGGGGSSPFPQDRRIREGWATIKEDGLKSLYWAKKYIILREVSLDFLKTETSSSPTLSVSLKDIVSVNRTDMKPYCFEVVRMASSQNGVNSMASDAPRRTVFVSVKSEQELYDWVDDVYSRCPSMGGVSNPTNFTHKVHVGFDPVSGGFTGLPEEWSKLLNSSAITKEDYQKNPQAVIEVLEFYTEGQRGLNQNGYGMGPAPAAAVAAQQRQMAQMSLGGPQPGPTRQDTRDREQWERERERDAYREQEYEKDRREQQAQRERQERDRRQRELEKEQERRERDREERLREEELFNSQRQQERLSELDDDYPQKGSTAQTPIMMGGGGGGLSSQGRYNPMAPKTSTKAPQKVAPGLRDMDPRRPAPSAPSSTLPRPSPSQRSQQSSQQQKNLHAPSQSSQQKSREPSPASGTRQQQLTQQQQGRLPPGTAKQQPQTQSQSSRIPAPTTPTVKPLNVPVKAAPAKEAVMKQERKENQRRISNMTEAQVMDKLRSVVSPTDPNQLYTKIKKVGQGASGSVYVAKVNGTASSSVSMSMLASSGKGVTNRVAIKQMDLAHQPRKELIVNEILVMKESQHPNIVNFLDAFLKGPSELWVVMEYMEGGALTDVIDNNSLEEDQIATICFEVSFLGMEILFR